MRKTWRLIPLALLLFVTASTQAPAGAEMFFPGLVTQDAPQQCQVLCATTHCTSNADCPEGRCNFACPGEGCCVTN